LVQGIKLNTSTFACSGPNKRKICGSNTPQKILMKEAVELHKQDAHRTFLYFWVLKGKLLLVQKIDGWVFTFLQVVCDCVMWHGWCCMLGCVPNVFLVGSWGVFTLSGELFSLLRVAAHFRPSAC